MSVEAISILLLVLGMVTMLGMGAGAGYLVGHARGKRQGESARVEEVLTGVLETDAIQRDLAHEAAVLEEVVDTVQMVAISEVPGAPEALPVETAPIVIDMAASNMRLELEGYSYKVDTSKSTEDATFWRTAYEHAMVDLAEANRLRRKWYACYRRNTNILKAFIENPAMPLPRTWHRYQLKVLAAKIGVMAYA